ncbi:methylenetetrahydrofolate reductase [Zafaria cholistanensis]|uniref:Methylenetetrahydrofolate reductase n=1 Tax=Zafaria cholistanensis TaxID=1682741 RepID=A0A5A7NRP7_9MICC|nr:methylenetetrahydrofolate reductase [Zafaria cholistanensis]GER23236.1 methylenetetrahydrofolate reductase [Zafaria cholistanensis]
MERSKTAPSPQSRQVLAGLVRNIGYEVMPFKGTEEKVLKNVPASVPLTVTATGGKGIEVTVDLATRLRARGYSVAPHLPARLFRDEAELSGVVDQLREADVRRVFIIAGDAPQPAGQFPDALSLLKSMDAMGHHFEEVGIGGYPEGHASFPAAAIEQALEDKAPLATRILTQICFDAKTTTAWAAGIKQRGVDLPVFVGMPGPVSRQKLVRVSAGLGLGQSARFLQKQQNMLWRFFLPGGYRPDRLIRGLAAAVPKADTNIRGFHIFTFNDLAETEAWRRRLVQSVAEQVQSVAEQEER